MVGNANPVVSDQRKHALEALQRRFDSADAELLQQKQKQEEASIKRSNREAEEKGQGKKRKEVSSSSSLFPPAPAALEETHKSGRRSSSTPLPKRGNFAVSGHTPSRGTPGASDAEASGPAYSQLCLPVHENLLTSDAELSSKKGSVVDKILHEFLQHGDSAAKYMQGSRRMKIDNWLLLDSFVQGRGSLFGACKRASHIHSKRSKRHMSMKQHRKHGSFTLPHEFHKFDIFKPMHEMWKDYIMQLFKNAGKTQLAQCLLTADLHGAILLVVECKVTSFTGASGIMVRETAETFGIITQDDKFRVVPKKGSIFVFQADCWKITLHGDKFTSRNLNV